MSSTQRLVSLDAFRGATIAAMIMVNNPGTWSHVYAPLRHAEWHGWTFTDLIFPFFLFIVGVAIVLAFTRRLTQNVPKKELYKKIVRRTIILFLLGLFLNAFPHFDFSTLRIMGVLQRIAICYFVASIIFLHTSVRGQWAWAIGLMLIYWALMAWVPVPGVGAGSLAKGQNFAAYVDSLLLKGHMWAYTKTWDPEGIVSTLPAISTTLFGVLTGHLIISKKSHLEKIVQMFLWGNFALFVGIVWDKFLPINKNLWTSSYAVFMAGMALIVLAFCYYFIDYKNKQKWAKPFVVYGSNAITVYVLSGIIADLLYVIRWQTNRQTVTLHEWLYQTLFASWLQPLNASLAFALTLVLLLLGAMWILYRKKIFIKI